MTDKSLILPGSSTSTKITTTVSARASATASCPASVAVTFDELVTTTYGTNIKIVGNNAATGNWSPANGVALSASQYTSTDPLWDVMLNVTAGTVLQYKYIKVDSSGTVTW